MALHGIGLPAFQRRCLALLEQAVARGEARASRAARLADRIRFNERRPQLYGTQFDWDERGELSPWPIEDGEGVDARRRAAGLPPLAEAVRNARATAAREGAAPPRPYAERQAEILAWARRVGWLDTKPAFLTRSRSEAVQMGVITGDLDRGKRRRSSAT